MIGIIKEPLRIHLSIMFMVTWIVMCRGDDLIVSRSAAVVAGSIEGRITGVSCAFSGVLSSRELLPRLVALERLINYERDRDDFQFTCDGIKARSAEDLQDQTRLEPGRPRPS